MAACLGHIRVTTINEVQKRLYNFNELVQFK